MEGEALRISDPAQQEAMGGARDPEGENGKAYFIDEPGYGVSPGSSRGEERLTVARGRSWL